MGSHFLLCFVLFEFQYCKQFDLSRYTEDELHVHIENLHEYNDIKDVSQMLLGRLGGFSQVDLI